MKELTIFLAKEKVTLKAKKGDRLADVLHISNCNVDMPCGGNGICNKCNIIIDGEVKLLCKEIVSKDITICFPLENKVGISSKIFQELVPKTIYKLCIDIGTTNIEAALIDEDSQLAISFFLPNSQRNHGLDVMARINFATNYGVNILQKQIVDDINSILDVILNKNVAIEIESIIISANTVMTNILLGADIASMGAYPYNSKYLDSVTIDASSIGIHINSKLITVPCGAAFFGGDAVASLCTLETTSKWVLLLDLGTNLEVALVNEDSYIVTSAAAGPCLESAGITCGMTAGVGVITHFDIINGRKIVRGLGDKFVGLAATALVDVIANLLQVEELDYSGNLLDKDNYYLTDNVYITSSDIRAFQLAKSAVRSAIDSLLRAANIQLMDIGACYLAGGISLGLSLNNAACSGLLPKELVRLTTCIGNTSLRGAIKFANDRDTAVNIAKKIAFLELNNQSNFFFDYIKNINFDKI